MYGLVTQRVAKNSLEQSLPRLGQKALSCALLRCHTPAAHFRWAPPLEETPPHVHLIWHRRDFLEMRIVLLLTVAGQQC